MRIWNNRKFWGRILEKTKATKNSSGTVYIMLDGKEKYVHVCDYSSLCNTVDLWSFTVEGYLNTKIKFSYDSEDEVRLYDLSIENDMTIEDCEEILAMVALQL